MSALAIVMLLCAGGTDEALREVETKQAEARGRREKSIEAIEKAIRTAPGACPRCPEFEHPGTAPTPAIAMPSAAPPLPAVTIEKTVIPWWVWAIVAGTGAAGIAVGIGIGAGIASSR